MPGPTEVRNAGAALPQRWAPRIREVTIGWKKADVLTYLSQLKSEISGTDALPLLRLGERFFARTPHDEAQGFAEATIHLVGSRMDEPATLEQRITPELIDKVIEKIKLDPQKRFNFEDVVEMLFEEAEQTEVSPTLIESFATLAGSLRLPPEQNNMLDFLKTWSQKELEEIYGKVKGEFTSNRILLLETVLTGLKERGLTPARLEASFSQAGFYRSLAEAYVFGFFRNFRYTEYRDSNILENQAVRDVLADNLDRIEVFTAGLKALNMTGEEALALRPDFTAAFLEICRAGDLAVRILDSMENRNFTIGEDLAQYGKDEIVTRVFDNVLPICDPAGAAEVLIYSLSPEGTGEKGADPQIITALIRKLFVFTQGREARLAILGTFFDTLADTKFDLSDPRAVLAKELLFEYSPTAFEYIISEYLALRQISLTAPVLKYFSENYGSLKRIENILNAEFSEPPTLERARGLFNSLRTAVIQGKIDELENILDSAVRYLNWSFLKAYPVLARFQLIYQTIVVEGGNSFEKMWLTQSALRLTFKVMDVEKLTAESQLEAARRAAEDAVQFARVENLSTAAISYLPGFLAAALTGRFTDKDIEELCLILRKHDRGNGLFAALDLVQNVFKSEVYTQLANILKEIPLEEIPGKIAVFVNILWHDRLKEKENRFQLALKIFQEIQNDQKTWARIIKLFETGGQAEAVIRIRHFVRGYLEKK